MMNEILLSMLMGCGIGVILGFILGRDNPNKTQLMICYLKGKLDHARQIQNGIPDEYIVIG